MVTKDIFLYHLDYELQKLFALKKYNYCNIYTSFRLVTRIAFLLCNQAILVPASNYFESDLAFRILNELVELNEIGGIKLISSSYNIDELLNKKINQHGTNFNTKNYHYNDFASDKQEMILPGDFKKRKRSASSDIKSGWYSFISNKTIVENLWNLSQDGIKSSIFEDTLFEMPRKLGDRAYISDYILPLLPIKEEQRKNADCILNTFVTREYIASFLKEFNVACLKDIPIIDSTIVLPDEQKNDFEYISYSKIATLLKISKYQNGCVLDFISHCSTSELIDFKYSIEWQEFLDKLTNNTFDFSEIRKAPQMNNNYEDIKIGIITALPKECAAMKSMMYEVEECFFDDKGAGHRFFVGKIDSANQKTHRVALSQCGMGNNKAAIRATNMLTHFKSLDTIIMTGIAGGIPSFQNDDKQIRLGDIVVSTGIEQYDFTKETIQKTESRSNSDIPSAQLLEAIDIIRTQEYENTFPWHNYIDELQSNPYFKRPAPDTDQIYDKDGNIYISSIDNTVMLYPNVFLGKIASANNLLKNPNKRDDLKKTYSVLAVEMEASGIADATWNHSVGYLVIRGICDYCDSHKNDLWQGYAALAAAAYTRFVVENLPCF